MPFCCDREDDVEALATAHTLRHLMSPHCLHLFGVLPVVLTQADTAVAWAVSACGLMEMPTLNPKLNRKPDFPASF